MSAADTIGKLFVQIGANLDGLHEGIGPGGKADKELEGFTSRTNAVLANVAKFGIALGAIGVVGVAVGFGIAAKSAGDFQTKLTQLVTGAGETKDNLSVVSAGILKMAGETGTSAMQLADGLYMIESAGYHGAQGLSVLKASAQGAKVGASDLATVSDAVTTVLKDYHMSASQAGDATNFLIGVVSQGKTHMQDLAQSLAMVLPFASALNIPLDQVGGAMATMTAKGIPAADAATYLRFTMAALANETPKGHKALADIGLKADDVAKSLTTRGLLPTLELIQQHLSKKFPEGGAKMFAALADIVGGTRGLGAALQLTGVNLSDFIANTKGVSDQIKAGKGHVLGWAEVQGDLNFQIQSGTAAMEAAGIKVGQKLLPPLTDLLKNVVIPLIPRLADMGSNFLTKILPPVESFAGWLSKLRPDFQKAFDIISVLKPYIIEVGGAWIAWNIALAVTKALNMATMAIQFVAGLYQIIRTIGLATSAQWLFNIAMDANPIGVVILALTALGAAFIWAYNNIGPFHDIVNAAWGGLQSFGDWIGQVFGPLMGGLGKLIGDIFQGHWGDIGADVNALHFGAYASKDSRAASGEAASRASTKMGGALAFASGGMVPGPIGAPVLATVHGGERVLTPEQQQTGGSAITSLLRSVDARLESVDAHLARMQTRKSGLSAFRT